MLDLLNSLNGLNGIGSVEVSETDVAADVARGRRALRRRRVRRGGVAALSGGLVAVAVSLAMGIGAAGSDQPHATLEAPAPTSDIPSTWSSPSSITLVAWHGEQLPGFTVDMVPEGYVLQGVTDSVLDIARPSDTTPLDSFSGKLVVMLSDQPTNPGGTAVSVNGLPGWITETDGATLLRFNDGVHDVVVQAWEGLELTQQQLITFAAGVTIGQGAVPGHG